MRILLIEDEQIAGEKLKGYIKNHVEQEAHVSWVRSVSEVREALIVSESFDLVFSDIELLDGNVFEVYDSMEVKSPIIFCTAYDRFVMKAFETNGIAYLLKPYDEEQFLTAWKKYQLLFDKNEANRSTDLLTELKHIITNKQTAYKSRFTIKKPNGVFLLNTDDIVYFQSQGDFILAIDSKKGKHVINQSVQKLIQLLDPTKFFQINRSEIINVDYITKFEPHFKNRLSIYMIGEKEPLHTSNSRSPEFRAWLG